MRVHSLAAAAVGAASALALAVPAHALTFADYSGTASDNPNLTWTRATGGASGALTTTGVGDTASVYFSFLNPTLATLSNLPATFTLNASSTAMAYTDTSGDMVQPDLTGTFSFIYNGPSVTVGKYTYTSGTNLLSGSFSGAEIVGKGSAGTAKDSVLAGGTVSFTTGINPSQLAFSTASGADRGFSLTLTSTTPIYAKSGKVLRSFTADSTGGFSAVLSAGGGAGVPEPATWAMMLAGFGMAGYALRRRTASATVA